MLKLYDLKVNSMKNPIAVDTFPISFSWKIRSDHQKVFQKAYKITLKNIKGSVLWTNQVENTDESLGILCPYDQWDSRSAYVWELEVWDNYGEKAQDTGSFETAFLQPKKEWTASWIEPKPLHPEENDVYKKRDQQIETMIAGMESPAGCSDINIENLDIDSVGPDGICLDDRVPPYDPALGSHMGQAEELTPDFPYDPALRVRHRFTLKDPSHARLFITAHGVYNVWLNGHPVYTAGFAPDFTNYDHLLQYQVYNVEPYVVAGENLLTFSVGDGWYKGKISGSKGNDYGNNHGLLYTLYTESEAIESGPDARYSYDGPIRYSDFFRGERYDSRLEEPWMDLDFDDRQWPTMETASYDKGILKAQMAEPIGVITTLPALSVRQLSQDQWLIDFGQNVSGYVRIKITGRLGDEVSFKYYEMLNMDQTLPTPIKKPGIPEVLPDWYIDNHEARDVFVCCGKERQWHPSFTYHAFRYVVMTGFYGIPDKNLFQAVVLGSLCETTGHFETSNWKLNKLQSNIWWSQLGNMFSIPTDCPVRERAGWTGDVWVYGQTACYLQNLYAFFRRWLTDCRIDQKENGEILNVVPRLKGYGIIESHPNAGWADVIVKLPYMMYQMYGDKTILEENFEAMRRWLQWEEKTAVSWFPRNRGTVTKERLLNNRYLWNSGFHVGDHLIPVFKPYFDPDADEYKKYVASAMFSYSAGLFSEIAQILGKAEIAGYYKDLKEKIQKAMRQEYMDEKGDYSMDLQAAYVLALGLDLMSKEMDSHMLQKLVSITKAHGKRMETGFLSVPYLLQVLSENGYEQLALDLLYQEQCPSWLYEVDHDATTMWEAWDEVKENGKIGFASKNHYAFGSVGTWMYENLAGIRPLAPGFKKFSVQPVFNCRLNRVSFQYETPYGEIDCEWKIYGKQFTLILHVPENTQAALGLKDTEEIKINGNPLPDSILGSGDYTITGRITF